MVHLLEIRTDVDGSGWLTLEHNPLDNNEFSVFKTVKFGLTPGNGRYGWDLPSVMAPICGEGSAIELIDTSRHDIGGNLQCRQRVLGRLRVTEQQSRNTVGTSNLSLNREVVHHCLTKGHYVVSHKGRTGHQQGGATDQDVHHGQSFSNRIVASLDHPLSAFRLIIPFHPNGYFQQLRTESQAGALGAREVNLEAHFIGIHDELDHAPVPRKLWHVTNC